MNYRSLLLALFSSIGFLYNPRIQALIYITSEKQFQEQVLQPDVWAVVNFFVPSSPIYRCPLCEMINATLTKFDLSGWPAQNNVKLFAVDVSLMPAIAVKYGYSLPPTITFFSKGNKTGPSWQVKAIPKIGELQAIIQSNMVR